MFGHLFVLKTTHLLQDTDKPRVGQGIKKYSLLCNFQNLLTAMVIRNMRMLSMMVFIDALNKKKTSQKLQEQTFELILILTQKKTKK